MAYEKVRFANGSDFEHPMNTGLNKTGLQPVSMTCGTVSLFWRVHSSFGAKTLQIDKHIGLAAPNA